MVEAYKAWPDEAVPFYLIHKVLDAEEGTSISWRTRIKGWFPIMPYWNWAPAMVGLLLVLSIFHLAIPNSKPVNQVVKVTNGPSLPSRVNDVPAFGVRSVSIRDDFQNVVDQQYLVRQEAMAQADADTLMMRGRRMKALGRMDLALQDFETIVRHYPDYDYIGDVLTYRAQSYAVLGNIDQAIESLEFYLKKFPSKANLILPMIEQIRRIP